MVPRLLMLALFFLSAKGRCPDLASLRSQAILDGFDASMLTGKWYEQAYVDVAQVGATVLFRNFASHLCVRRVCVILFRNH